MSPPSFVLMPITAGGRMHRRGGRTMSERAATLLTEALKLSDEEREALADALWDSLDGPSSDYDAMTEEEFKAELDRRAEELRQHPERAIPWEQVEKMR
jgi:putative addiction module component (TIGR02574 family)